MLVSVICHVIGKSVLYYGDNARQLAILTHLPLDKMAAISRMIFSSQMHFREWKILYFD